MSGNGEAAGMLVTPTAADAEADTESLGHDGDERKLSQVLQARATSRGYTLRRVRSGFLLQRGNSLIHVIGLESVAALLPGREARR